MFADMNILFLCTGNSCRSQMAAGFARAMYPAHTIASAGIEAHGMNPRAVAVMSEVGIDISAQPSQTIDELPPLSWDLVVTVCDSARENCPVLPGARMMHVSFDDPPRLTQGMNDDEALPVYRRVRDEIATMIRTLA
jgi:arsenate reductase